MNRKTKILPKSKAEGCLCQGVGPLLSQVLRQLGPPEGARRHFESARVEFLKGLRACLDARIEAHSKSASKGEKINVE